MNVLELTADLIKFNTINPPGNEKNIAEFIGKIFLDHGFSVEYQSNADQRLNLIASKGLSNIRPPIVFSGHFDVVPLGNNEWSTDPFSGEIIDGKIYGRGSSDMKSGLAAIICAAVDTYEKKYHEGGIMIIFTADEEPGCFGAKKLFSSDLNLGSASALIVGEPTSNKPFIGHKGALYLNVKTVGVTAHSALPELGDNAIYKAAKAICKIANLKFNVEKDPLLGFPTINVGKINGGLNLNSVPDKAMFTVDLRSTTKLHNKEALELLTYELGRDVEIETLVDLCAVATPEDDSFIQMVYQVCNYLEDIENIPKAAPFLTDSSIITPALNNPPTIILGPGETSMAHQTDEFCYINKIEESVEIYKSIIENIGAIR